MAGIFGGAPNCDDVAVWVSLAASNLASMRLRHLSQRLLLSTAKGNDRIEQVCVNVVLKHTSLRNATFLGGHSLLL